MPGLLEGMKVLGTQALSEQPESEICRMVPNQKLLPLKVHLELGDVLIDQLDSNLPEGKEWDFFKKLVRFS